MLEAQQQIELNEITQVGQARRNAARLAEIMGLNATLCGNVSIVATELANNLLYHAGGGKLLLRPLQDSARSGIELLAIDSGPGMDVAQCLQDGFSTRGTAGNGLGAVQRLSHEFDAYSGPRGSVVLSRIYTQNQGAALPLRLGAICLPMRGEIECGDAWNINIEAGVLTLVVADGLGHGGPAADASRAAVAEISSQLNPQAILQAAHTRMHGTRGGAVAVAKVDLKRGALEYAGIGNISGTLHFMTSRQGLVSHSGIVGSHFHRAQTFSYNWQPRAWLIMHSDGLQTRWLLEEYPGVLLCDPALIAAVLYRDFSRGRDDTTVLVVELQQESSP